jgi:hypothetical protein
MILVKAVSLILLALVGCCVAVWTTFGLAVAIRLLHGILDAVGY